MFDKYDKNIFHKTFEISILLKALDGLLELIGGFLLLIISSKTIRKIPKIFFAQELTEDPNDLIANYLIKAGENLSIDAKIFGIIFLLSHGVIKIGLVYALYKKKLWAYPLSIFIFTLFIIYQLYRYSHTHSLFLLFITILDFIVISLIYVEYKKLKAKTKNI